MEQVRTRISRRAFLGATGAAVVVGMAGGSGTAQATTIFQAQGGSLRIHDLSHTITPQFPVFPGAQPFSMATDATIEEDGFYRNNLSMTEHVGTHMDAPAHFDADGVTADRLPVENLFAHLAVINISARAAQDADAQVVVDDILAWESQHGRLPSGAFIAMYSGWESRLSDPDSYVNQGTDGALHFPGFHPDAAEFLVGKRDIVGIGVDTLSLDFGASKDFGTHNTVLPAGRYGLENMANLGRVSAAGATLIVGGPKHVDASGGPSRVYAVEGGALRGMPGSLPGTGGGGMAGRR